jgi:general secretion pathway protein A
LFLSATHREALGSLVYGLEAGCGFIALIATPGMGKTMLLFEEVRRLRSKANVVFLFQAISTPVDCMRAILADLGVHETSGSLFDLQSKLNETLTEQSRSGKRLVIFFDEAQALDDSVLELVRMLSNFETQREKLIQIVLSGQPQLADKLALPTLLQLRQRISMVARLEPFSVDETVLYIDHRLRTAGYHQDEPLFTADALTLIARCSQGIPRNINNLCFNALSLGCALKRKQIDGEIIREVVRDLDLESLREKDPDSVPQVHEDRTPEVPLVASAVSAPSSLMSRLAKVAVASAVLLGLSVTDLQSHRSNPPDVSAHANSVAPVSVSEPLSPVGRDSTLQLESSVSTVQVAAGDSLYRICEANFRTCDPELIRQIRKMNPGLANPDHIESGQTIRIPIVPAMLGATATILEPAGMAPPEKRDVR